MSGWRRLPLLSPALSRLSHHWRKGFRKGDEAFDAEREQALIRLAVGAIVVPYLFLTGVSAVHLGNTLTIGGLAVVFLTAALALLVYLLLHPVPSPPRRYLGILLDLSMTSAALAHTGPEGAPLLCVYLWVIVGNGFRFGPRYMVVATLVSLAGFSAAIGASEYWQSHPYISASYLLVLVVIPLYMGALLAKLRAALRKAFDASQAKSQFLAKMSHELRTPLNGIIGMSDLLMDSRLGDQERKFVTTIHHSGKTLLAIINDILDLSRIEAGRLSIVEVEFDPHRLVAEIVAMFSPQAEGKQLALAHRFDPRVPFLLRGDAQHLRQILMNIVGNAVKYTPRGSVEIRIMPGDITPAGGPMRVRFEVEDTGPGIAPEDQPHIFDSFRQAKIGPDRRTDGTGLGTAIARELTQLMGGSIGLRSDFGSGSVFWFELPFAVVPTASPSDAPSLAGTHALLLGTGKASWAVLERLTTMGVTTAILASPERMAGRLKAAKESGRSVGLILVIEHDFGAEIVSHLSGIGEADDPPLRFLLRDQGEGVGPLAMCRGFHGVLGLPLQQRELEIAVHAARSARLYPENVVSLGEHYSRLPSSVGRPLHILVAEDNETNRKVTRAILEKAGHRLTMVEDGEAALDVLRERVADFDLLLLDKNMPGHDGLEVFQALRFMYPGISLPTIILSADATLDAIEESRRAGVHAYLTKPVESRRLLETIEDICRGKETTDKGNRTDKPSREHPEEEETALFDDEKLDSLLALDQDGTFFQELATGFKRDTEHSVNAIATALKSADYPAMRAAVHALQGCSSELGAIGLVAAAVRFRALKPVELQSSEAEAFLRLLRQVHTSTLAYIAARQPGSQFRSTPTTATVPAQPELADGTSLCRAS